jgi:beta-glucosidase-like glycosyl hydrolase
MAGVLHESNISDVAIEAINAGVDILMFSYRMERAVEALKAVQEAVEAGKIKKERIFQSYQRICELKRKQKKRLEELGKRCEE